MNPQTHSPRRAFTLIELLIVVLIIAILAAIAVPNFLEFQTRAKVSRAQSDMRTLTIGIEAYRVDFDLYPEGTDNPDKYPQQIVDFLQPLGLTTGYYAFRTRGANGELVGRDFAGLTTPIAFISSIPSDVFAKPDFLTYCYRPAKERGSGYILTSCGPDNDLLATGGVGSSDASNPLSTAADWVSPARMGDINEKAVALCYEGDPHNGTPASFVEMESHLRLLRYDPTNGTVSEGDLYRLGGASY